MVMDYDGTDIARVYDKARTLAPEALRLWLDLVGRDVAPAPGSLIPPSVDFRVLLRHRPSRRLRATVLATRRSFAAASRETTEVRSWPKKPPIYRHAT